MSKLLNTLRKIYPPLLFLFVLVTSMSVAASSAANFTGEWAVYFPNNSGKFKLYLTQTDNELKGTFKVRKLGTMTNKQGSCKYDYGNEGRNKPDAPDIVGIVKGNMATVNIASWKGNVIGKAIMTLDGQTLNWKVIKAPEGYNLLPTNAMLNCVDNICHYYYPDPKHPSEAVINARQAIIRFTKAIQATPNNSQLYEQRGQNYMYDKQYDKALTDYTTAINMERRPYYKKIYYIERAQIYGLLGQHDKAAEDSAKTKNINADLKEEIARNPELQKPSFPTMMQSLSLMSSGKGNEAIANVNESIKIRPKEAALYVCRATLYEYMNKFNEAVADLTTAIGLETDKQLLASAYEERSKLYNRLGKKDLAEQDAQKANGLKRSIPK